MHKLSVVIFLINGLLLTSGKPQYGQPSSPAQPPPPPPRASQPSYGSGGAPSPPPPPQQSSYGGPQNPPPPPPPPGPAPTNYEQSAPQQPQQPNYGGNGADGNSGSNNAGGNRNSGDLTVQCKASPDASGTIKYDCSGANKDAITLKTEHILWLENQAGATQNLDIEIPNYNIDEFIKAAYKALGPQEGAKINVLLKKPDVTYNAEKADAPPSSQQPPAVSVNYQPVDKVSVHYPSQKAYRNGGGAGASGNNGLSAAPQPQAPPQPHAQPQPARNDAGAPGAPGAGGPGGAYNRPYRESGSRYYFSRQ